MLECAVKKKEEESNKEQTHSLRFARYGLEMRIRDRLPGSPDEWKLCLLQLLDVAHQSERSDRLRVSTCRAIAIAIAGNFSRRDLAMARWARRRREEHRGCFEALSSFEGLLTSEEGRNPFFRVVFSPETREGTQMKTIFS